MYNHGVLTNYKFLDTNTLSLKKKQLRSDVASDDKKWTKKSKYRKRNYFNTGLTEKYRIRNATSRVNLFESQLKK